MKKAAVALTLFAAVAIVGCGKKTPPMAPAPVAPEAPPPAPPPPPEVMPQQDEYTRIKNMSSDEINRLGLLDDIHFEFNRSDIREEDRAVLAKDAEVLKKFDFLVVTVEGHCDSRGTVEYNLALGERRAAATYDYLVSLGVPAARLKSVSYGKEFPLCDEQTEECWARNRRAHFSVTGKTQ